MTAWQGSFPSLLLSWPNWAPVRGWGGGGGLGGDTGVRGTYHITLWSSFSNAIKWTLFARLTFFSTQSRHFSLILRSTDTLQLPPALHAFRTSPLPGFYPTFHGMDAINDPSNFSQWLETPLLSNCKASIKYLNTQLKKTLWNCLETFCGIHHHIYVCLKQYMQQSGNTGNLIQEISWDHFQLQKEIFTFFVLVNREGVN